MKIAIEPTEHFFQAGDFMVRVWVGNTNEGVPIRALVAGVEMCAADAPPPLGLVSIPAPDREQQRRWADRILMIDQARRR